jgi:hypothetical protein
LTDGVPGNQEEQKYACATKKFISHHPKAAQPLQIQAEEAHKSF